MEQNNSWFDYGNSLPVEKREIFFMDLGKKTLMVEELQREHILPITDYYESFRQLHNLEDYVIPEKILKKYL